MNGTVVRVATLVVAMIFAASWTDTRNVRGQIHTEEFDGQLPYASNGPATLSRRPGKLPTLEEDEFETLMAESAEDFNPVAEFRSPAPDTGTGASNVDRSPHGA